MRGNSACILLQIACSAVGAEGALPLAFCAAFAAAVAAAVVSAANSTPAAAQAMQLQHASAAAMLCNC
jgi:hypothetical protein